MCMHAQSYSKDLWTGYLTGDVTKFEFEFDNVWTWNVFNSQNLTNVLSTLLSNANSWKNTSSFSLSFAFSSVWMAAVLHLPFTCLYRWYHVWRPIRSASTTSPHLKWCLTCWCCCMRCHSVSIDHSRYLHFVFSLLIFSLVGILCLSDAAHVKDWLQERLNVTRNIHST